METYVCLENIRSLFNIGAIFRTCSFYGINNVILLGYSGKDAKGNLHQEILKTSLGSEKDLDIIMMSTAKELYKFAKDKRLEVVAIEQTATSKAIHEYEFPSGSIVMFGNEAEGITKELLEKADAVLEIKRKGIHNSLNVTTTCGIVLDIISNQSN